MTREGTKRISARSVPTVVAASTTAAALAGVLLMYSAADRAGAAPPGTPGTTSAELVHLNISRVPALHTEAFDGTYGTAGSPPLNGGEDTGDFSDPDGVLAHYKDGTHAVVTSNADAKHYAKVDAAGIEVRLRDADLITTPPAGSVGSLNTYAECTPPPYGPYALGYAHTDGQQIGILGHRVGVGTTELQVSGAELGEPDTLGVNTLRVTFTQHVVPADEVQTPGAYEAEAWFDVKVSGALRDPEGEVVYDGPIAGARLGEVHARCGPESPSPSPSPTDTGTESPSPSPSPTESDSPSPSPTDTGSPTPSPTETESPMPSPSPTDTEPPSPSPSPTGTESPTPSPSPTDTGSPTPHPSPSPSDSDSGTPAPPPTPSPTSSESESPTPTPTTTGGGTGGDTGGGTGGTDGGSNGGAGGGSGGGTDGGDDSGAYGSGGSHGGAYGSGGSHGGGGELADTGDQVALMGGAAAVLTAVGGVLFVRRRRAYLERG
ncbi:LPXTG cell wall anchor domain-containing protein [Streptomyces sp. NPDC059398]|uniref:LPXTG cell wall anchor domain-containing protein n=1 Tax=Streptomyces sp. NPDC059398 TaxID=3346820 RepID=UPI00367DC103